jgi:hypothetical protein
MVPSAIDSYKRTDLDGAGDPVFKDYPTFEPLLYSLDLFVPFIDLGQKAAWKPNTQYVWTASLPTLSRPSYGELGSLFGCYLRESPVIWNTCKLGEAPPSWRITWVNGNICLGWLAWFMCVVEVLVGAALTAILVTTLAGLLREGQY